MEVQWVSLLRLSRLSPNRVWALDAKHLLGKGSHNGLRHGWNSNGHGHVSGKPKNGSSILASNLINNLGLLESDGATALFTYH